jgi:hypothetical protein
MWRYKVSIDMLSNQRISHRSFLLEKYNMDKRNVP